MVALVIEKTRDAVAHAIFYAKLQFCRTVRLPPADDLAEIVAFEGEGASEQGETDCLTDRALTRFVGPGDRDQTVGRQVLQLKAGIFEYVSAEIAWMIMSSPPLPAL
ncbi:hypothetical protein QQ73_15300 [Candidatus Endoriftia persephone str. Guaymas]|nr:hypothetical protein [Candidatus Endoriftia persephone str. Guaymas]